MKVMYNAAGGAEIRLGGYIVDDDLKELYDWYGIAAVCPRDFRDIIDSLDGKQELVVWISSYGGDVAAGSAIYTALKNYAGKVTVKIDGVAVSAASFVAMAGKKVLISPTAEIMIHNPWSLAEGDADDMRRSAQSLDSCKEAIINAYVLKTKLARDRLSAMMDEEKWISAVEAKELGFVDKILFDDDNQLGATPRGAMNALAMPVSESMIKSFRERNAARAEQQTSANEAAKLRAEIELLEIT